MRVLVISPVHPFPARSGMTNGIANYILLLVKLGWVVDLVVIGDEQPAPDVESIGRVYYLRKYRNTIKAIFEELIGQMMYACNFELTPKNWKEVLRENNYEVILASPINVVQVGVELVEHISRYANYKPGLIAAISDPYTTVLRTAPAMFKFLFLRLNISWLRSLYMGRLETHILKAADKIFVQSEKDKIGLRRIGKGKLDKNIVVFASGVDERLFDLSIQPARKYKRFCFVADFRPLHYRLQFKWLYENVWRKLNQSNREIVLVGRGLAEDNNKFFGFLRGDNSVKIDSTFYENVASIYVDKDILLAPIFKQVGLVTKVGESLAAGLVVIGDESAFNGIKGFKNERHGLIANTAVEMIQAIERIEADESLYCEIRTGARALATMNLRWATREQKLDILLEEIRGGGD